MTKSSGRIVVGVHEAKTHLSRLLHEVESGAEVQINRGTTPIARILPLEQPPRKRQLGTLKGRIRMTDDFNEVDEDTIDLFENGETLPA
ncbi:type II toxin-antitoxin system Phd/YefM family antitoxin [Microbacterium sp.]|uniref:type II toxin-antitoxin system Phd/YefM family antitoxin n=1 Tax=Microbacterium sp. TaxID=51671 RepID=UPI0028995E3C|nr:type II toxin-antitoxin system Phd/YefM family antitoxin [Microbacterium sp.]